MHWGAAVPGFLALVCLPFPIIFYYHGAPVRKRCRYAREAEAAMEKALSQQDKRDGTGPSEKDPAPATRTSSREDSASDRTLAETSPAGEGSSEPAKTAKAV